MGCLLAVPVWEASAGTESAALELAERHVILCELSKVEVEQLGSWLPLSQILALDAEKDKSSRSRASKQAIVSISAHSAAARAASNIAQRFSDYAVECFERVQAILQSKPEGKVLVQIVIADGPES